MNRNWTMAGTILAVLTTTALAVAQAPPGLSEKHHQTRYRLVDLGTFGGPQSYLPSGFDITAVHPLNNSGQFVGWADTSSADPFPDFCWDGDCFVGHAFVRGRNGKKDLGVLPGGASSDSTWIAENGLISGDSQNGELDPLVPGFPEIRAVLWRHGRMIDLGTLEGGYESVSASVNSRGQVTGFSTNTIPDPNSMVGTGYQARAFVWQNGAMQDLGTLGSGTDAIASLINERGQVMGWSYTDSNTSDTCIFVYGFPLSTGSFFWEEGKGITDLGGLGGSCTVAADLNERGQVVGQSFSTGDATGHAFRWDRKHGLIDLGTLGGDFSSAHAINNNGQAVGGSTMPPDNVQIDAALWKGNTAIDLGTVDSDECSYALSINTVGQVVGVSGTTNCESTRAFLWEPDSPMVDLNSLASNSDIYVTSAVTINDRGEIGALGVLPNGDEHAVLLIPCGEGDDQACETDATNTPAQLFNPSRLQSPVTVQHRDASKLRHRPSNRNRIPGLVSPTTSAAPKMPAAAVDPNVFDDLLGDKTLAQLTVRGLCNVDPISKKLTGGCVGSQGLHCVGKRDAVSCPAGQRARQPEWVQMCVYGRPYVDRGRSCNAF